MVAGREESFVLIGLKVPFAARAFPTRTFDAPLPPSIASVCGNEHSELTINGITEQESLTTRTFAEQSELNCVPEAFGVRIGENQVPRLAGVGGFVEAGERAFAAGHDDGGAGVEGLDASEVEVVGFGWRGAALPVPALVGSAEDGAIRSGGPNNSLSDVVDSAEVGGCGRGFDFPLSFGATTGQSSENK